MNTEFVESESVLPMVLSEIIGTVAKYAILQSPYTIPDNLVTVLSSLYSRIHKDFEGPLMGSYTKDFCYYDLIDYLDKHLKSIPEFNKWNEPKNDSDVEGGYVFVTAFSIIPADDDFIDLDALIRNVVNEIWKTAKETCK